MYKFNLGRDLYVHGRIGWRGLSKDEYLEKSDYRIINATALMDGYVDWNNCGFITKERYEESFEIMLKEGDILISKDGTLGKIGYVKNMPGPCSVASGIFVVRNTIPDKLDFDYLYHILKSPIFKDFIRRNKVLGSTIPHLYQRDLEEFELDLPSLAEQTKIAAVLNSIDNKITVNNEINDNLHQLIYEYYMKLFAAKKANGVLSDLLLDEQKSKTQVGEVKGRDGNYPFFTSGEEILKSDKFLVDGSHIFMNTGGNPDVKFYNGKCDYSTDTWCIKASNGMTEYLFLYLLSIKSFLEIKFFKGTGLKHLQKDLLRKNPVYIPKESELKAFNEVVVPSLEKMSANYRENLKLIAIRNKLLPLLMNGQVTIR